MVPQPNVPLAPYSTLGVGGSARWFVRAEHHREVENAHHWCAEHDVELFTLGGGSNLVISDTGFDGLVLQIGLQGAHFIAEGDEMVVDAQAGYPWDDLVASVVARGFAGLECLSGIPGSVGGTPIQNVGAYGQEVSGAIESVTVFDRVDGSTASLSASECGFSYRMSRFKGDDLGRFIVLSVRLRLRRGQPTVTYPDLVAHLGQTANAPSLAAVREGVLAIRRRKGMVVDSRDPDTRSVGSFFMNPIVTADRRDAVASSTGAAVPGFVLDDGRVKIPAAWLIERSGFQKGYRAGAVGVSSKHPLALVNVREGTAREIVSLAVRIKRAVVDRFGVWLNPEPVFVGFHDDRDVEYLRKAND